MSDINILEILKNYPVKTPLYSTLLGPCFLSKVLEHHIQIVSQEHESCILILDEYGKYTPEGECILFPSNIMRDWEKLLWKKGDIIHSQSCNADCIFLGFKSKNFALIDVQHTLRTLDDSEVIYKEKDWCSIESFTKIDEKDKQCYINTLEERFNGKFNPDTLEIESISVFKPFDKVLVRDSPLSPWKIDVFSHEDSNSKYPYICLSQGWSYCIPYEGNETLLGEK